MPLAYLSAPPRLWLIRSLSILALAASFGLTLWKWIAPMTPLPGCGGSDRCVRLLESSWSQWFSVPVTLLAATLWLTVLLLTLPRVQDVLGRTADQLLASAGTLLVAGALWFGGLLLYSMKEVCPWCLALHAAGLLAGGFILFATWRAERQGSRGLLAVAGQAGIAGLTLLVLGQLFGKPPETHELTYTLPKSEKESVNSPESSAGSVVPSGITGKSSRRKPETGTVSYFGGTLFYTLGEQPHVGPGNAPHVLTEFYDYTCRTCRSLHGNLKDLQESEPGNYAVILLPTPLGKECNPHQVLSAASHPHACRLARLALAFWRAAPRQFPAFHDFLMTASLPLTPETALTEARRLAPSVDLTEETETAWIDQTIGSNVAVWHRLSGGNPRMPKLLLRDAIVLHGSPVSRKRFLEVIHGAFPALSENAAFPDGDLKK